MLAHTKVNGDQRIVARHASGSSTGAGMEPSTLAALLMVSSWDRFPSVSIRTRRDTDANWLNSSQTSLFTTKVTHFDHLSSQSSWQLARAVVLTAEFHVLDLHLQVKHPSATSIFIYIYTSHVLRDVVLCMQYLRVGNSVHKCSLRPRLMRPGSKNGANLFFSDALRKAEPDYRVDFS